MGFICSLCRLRDTPSPFKDVSSASINTDQSRPERKINKPTPFTPSPARKRANRRAPHNKATKLPVRETLPTPTPEVSVSLQNQGLIATTDFSFTESLLDGSFGDLQFSPSAFEAFDAILDFPSHITDANLDINFSPSGMNTRLNCLNS